MTRRFGQFGAAALYLLIAARFAAAQAPIDVNVLRSAAAPVPASPAPPTPVASDTVAKHAETETDDAEKQAGPKSDPLAPEIRAELEQRMKSLDSAGLSAENKQKASALLKQAIDAFDAAGQQNAAAIEFQKQLDSLAAQIEDYKTRLAAPLRAYEEVAGEKLEQILERAKKAEDSVAHCKEELTKIKAEPKRRSQRLAEIPGQLAEAQLKLKQATDQLAAMGAEDKANVLDSAHRAAIEQAKNLQRAMLDSLQREQKLYQQGGDLLKVKEDYYARYVPYKEKRLAQLRDIINGMNHEQEIEAQQKARQAAAKAAEAKEVVRPKVITDLATENKDLAERRAKVRTDITTITKQGDETKNELQAITIQFEKAQKQCALDDRSSFSGRILRDQQSSLPNLWSLRRQNARHESEKSEVLSRTYDLRDKRSNLANIDEAVKELAAKAGGFNETDTAALHDLLAAKKDTLDQLVSDYDEYSGKLGELYANELLLIQQTSAYSEFIAGRVLWIPSCRPLHKCTPRPFLGALAWTFDPKNWREVGAVLIDATTNQPMQVIAFGLVFLAMLAVHRAARNRLREFGAEAKKRNCTRMLPTIHATWLTALIAMPWPALLAFVGWTLDNWSESEFVRSLSMSLRFGAMCLLLLEFSRNLCRRGGLAEAHFDWPEPCLVHLRRRLRWFTALGLPLVLWLVGLEVQTVEPWFSATLGRVCFIALMLLLSIKFQRLLLAKKSPYRQLMLVNGRGWFSPVQKTWRPLLAALPASLAILAGIGFYYTAQQAALRILETAALILAVMTLSGLTRRWLLVNRRRLAREQAKARRAQLAASGEADPTGLAAADLADDAIDLAAVSEQTQRLVRTVFGLATTVGTVLIWTAIMPAIAYGAQNKLPFAATLTWADLLVCALILAVTYVSVRGLPALLELVVLQHLPLDGGSRYAITSVTRYFFMTLGLVAAFNSMGSSWAQVQWLVAAMSVGLGFGLQEIFANFVSGIILLFERPIRIGDVVTLGDKTGVVNRIRMRATTIVDWDRKEYIVPNKDLVTERLLNWTLTDQMNRIEIATTVQQGSDTELACSLLLEAAHEQPHVLNEPAASAVFEGFTDQGLKLALRCFLPTLEHRGTTIHQLYTAIDRKFRAAGIEIPSPPKEMRVRLTRDAANMAFGSHNTAKPGKQNAA
jgi:potassium efflux system protein